MKYTDQTLAGIGKVERERLSIILRETQVTISVEEAAKVLKLSAKQAAKVLSKYAKKGWLSRIGYGIYIPVPLESETADVSLENPLAIAEKLFTPCYISGWSAAEYWGMTEQIFRAVVIMTQRKPKNRDIKIKDTQYLIHTAKSSKFFGLKSVWCNNIKVQIADPARLLLDLMSDPSLGGGLRSSTDMLKYYFQSNEKDVDKLILYLQKLENGAANKRLGFLVEKYFPEEERLLNACKKGLTAGNAKLDPMLESEKLITKWRLWVPTNWK